MLTYGGVSGLFAPVATAAAYIAGTHAPIENLGAFGTAAVTSTASTLTKLLIDLTAPQALLYFVNRDIYSREGGLHSFVKSFAGFSLATRAIEWVTGFGATGAMLTAGIPYDAAVLTNGSITSLPNNAAKFALYNWMVLKENPLPGMARQAYAAMAALLTTRI